MKTLTGSIVDGISKNKQEWHKFYISLNFPVIVPNMPAVHHQLTMRKILIFHFKWKRFWLIQIELALDLKTTAHSGNNQTDVCLLNWRIVLLKKTQFITSGPKLQDEWILSLIQILIWSLVHPSI